MQLAEGAHALGDGALHVHRDADVAGDGDDLAALALDRGDGLLQAFIDYVKRDDAGALAGEELGGEAAHAAAGAGDED